MVLESAFPMGSLLMSTVDDGRLVRFGSVRARSRRGASCPAHGRRVPLQEQPARILTLLVSRPDELVTREELRHLVWTNDTFVEFDASLNAAITKIRRALGDSASAPRFIETVPKRGYRFLADVQGLQPRARSQRPSSREESSLLLQRRRISNARQAPPDVRRARKTALLGDRGRDAALRLAAVTRTRATIAPRRSCGR